MFGKKSKKDQRKLEESGLPGYGVILGMKDTGVSFGAEGSLSQAFMVNLSLEVHVEGREPYRADVKHRVRMLELNQLQPGVKLGLVVDPDDPQNVMVATPDMAAKFQQAGMQTMGQGTPAAAPAAEAPPAFQAQPQVPEPFQVQSQAPQPASGGGGLFASLVT